MRDLDRLSDLARAANAYTKERLLPMEILRRGSITTSPVAIEQAKEKLVFQRTSSVYYKDPNKQKRNLLRGKDKKAALANTDKWIYTKAERYAVLDSEIRNGGAPELAQAVLDMKDALDVNVTYVADNNGEAICTGKENGLLELVAGRNGRHDVAYIRVLANFGASQASLDRALSIALERNAMRTAEALLQDGANPNATGIPSYFLVAIRDQNQPLYSMFLTAASPLNLLYINQALVEAVGRDSDLVALLIAHGADGMSNNGQALCAAVEEKSLEEVAMMLTNPEGELSVQILNLAVDKACAIVDESVKVRFLDMLFSAGARVNTTRIQDELLEAVKKNQVSLVELLIHHGTSPDRNDAEGLRLAIISGHAKLVQILLQGPIPEASTSRALGDANGLEDADDFEEIVRSLVEKGVSKLSLNKCLSDAVDKGCIALIPTLIEKGAALDYSNARCVRTALKRNNFSLLGTLLEGPCHPSILCEALPDAMKVQPPSERFDVVTKLLNKGVSGKQLHIALQTVAASAKDSSDYSLMEALMRFNASVDFLDKHGNCVCTAAAQRDERALDLLCQGDPSPDTVSNAIAVLPVSFATAEAAEYEQQVGMIITLLDKKAHGIPVAEMLIKAVRDDYREKALKALIQYGADPNYEHAKAVEEALRLPRISALDLILSNCKISKRSFAAQVPNALNPQGFSFEKVNLIVHASQDYDYEELLDKPLLDEVENNGARVEVIELLLNLGASVNFQHGGALHYAVNTGNVEVCRLILGAGVQHANIALIFPMISTIRDRATRYDLMQALLEAGEGDIGQDEALLQASREAINYDLSHVELLLKHHASTNFSSGAAVTASIETNNLPLLQRLVQTELNKKTLGRAFKLARKIECSETDRYGMFETLLPIYSDEEQVSCALVEAISRDPYDIKMPILLLNHGASLEFQNARAMREVAIKGSLELLKIFLTKYSSQSSRDAAFDSATNSHLGPEQRHSIYQSLLESGITQDLVSAALLKATYSKVIDHALLRMLISYDASLDFYGGNVVNGIVEKNDLPTLNVLLTGNISQKQTLDKSFSASMKLEGSDRLAIAKALLEKGPGVNVKTVSHHLARVVQQSDHELLDLMMHYAPDPTYNSGESLILSSRAGDARSTELLTRVEVPREILNDAFEQMLETRAIQMNKEGGLKTAEILLRLGVEQHLIDRALLDGFEERIDQLTKDLVELLIPYSPNVSGGDGKLFVDMARISDEQLFRRLASQKPDLDIVIPALVRTIEKEDELIFFLEHLEECAERDSAPLGDFIIFEALAQFPEGHLLATHLLNHGCRAGSRIEDEMSPANPSGEESMTVLIWALSRVEPIISEAVIMEVLADGHAGLKEEHNAEVLFQTDLTHNSATIIASATGRNGVLMRLIEIGTDLSQLDALEHSPLFYASRNGHLQAVEILINAGAIENDGSLHEASREGHMSVMKTLMANKHRVDYPSPIHADGQFGRAPLEELCLNATYGADNWRKRIHESISLLLPDKVANISKDGGKTMLHLALENATSSVEVTRELLSFPFVWENINDPVYLYTDEQGYVYSPTKYVDRLFAAEDPERCQNLKKLLHARKCKDRFYAHTISQPEGAVGLPDVVQEAVNKQKRADHEKAEEIKRREELAAKQRIIDAAEHAYHQEQTRQKHQQLMRQIAEQEAAEKHLAQEKQNSLIRHAQELQSKKQEGLKAENRIRTQGLAEEAVRRKDMADAELASEMAKRRAILGSEQQANSQRLAAEQQLMNLRASAAQDEYNRIVKACDYRVNAAKKEAEHRKAAASYQ